MCWRRPTLGEHSDSGMSTNRIVLKPADTQIPFQEVHTAEQQKHRDDNTRGIRRRPAAITLASGCYYACAVPNTTL